MSLLSKFVTPQVGTSSKLTQQKTEKQTVVELYGFQLQECPLAIYSLSAYHMLRQPRTLCSAKLKVQV